MVLRLDGNQEEERVANQGRGNTKAFLCFPVPLALSVQNRRRWCARTYIWFAHPPPPHNPALPNPDPDRHPPQRLYRLGPCPLTPPTLPSSRLPETPGPGLTMKTASALPPCFAPHCIGPRTHHEDGVGLGSPHELAVRRPHRPEVNLQIQMHGDRRAGAPAPLPGIVRPRSARPRLHSLNTSTSTPFMYTLSCVPPPPAPWGGPLPPPPHCV